MDLFGFELQMVGLPTTFSLAAVAVIGYIVGRWQKREAPRSDIESRREIKRAQQIAKELETIAREVRKSLAKHHTSVTRFRSRISELSDKGNDIGLQEICAEVETVLGPTMLLSNDLARAYDHIRRQSHQLLSFVEVRTDQLTGVCNRKSLDDSLESLVALFRRYDLRFSLAMFDIDHFKAVNDEQGHLAGDQVLRNVAQSIDHTARDTDVVTRYGGEEFVVLMPQTELPGACVFAERVRQVIERKLRVTVSGGVTCVAGGDTSQKVLERADSALYQAKNAGRNRVYVNAGDGIVPVEQMLTPNADGDFNDEPLAAVEAVTA